MEFNEAIETLRDEADDFLWSDDVSDIERGFLDSFLIDLNRLHDLVDRFETRFEVERAISRLEQVRASFAKIKDASTDAASLLTGVDMVIRLARGVAESLPVG